MNETLQAVIVLAIIILAGWLYVRSRHQNSNSCGDCPLKDNCQKRKK